MEINCTKHSVTAEEKIFSANGSHELKTTLPVNSGHTPKKILKCSLKAFVTSTRISEKTAMVEGICTLCAICIDEEDRLFSAERTVTFSKSFEAGVSLSGGEVRALVDEDKLTAQISQNGQIDINGELYISVTVIRAVKENVICDIDGKNIEQRHMATGITMPMGSGEKNLICEEEISVGNGQPSVECLIRHRADAVIEETKIVGKKVMIKGSFRIYVLYLPEEGTRPQSFEEAYPFSQLMDIDGLSENCRVHAQATVIFCELTPRPDIDGDLRSFAANLKLLVTAKAYCDDDIPLVCDAFSTDKKLELSRKELCFSRIKENINEKFIARKELEFTDGAIGSVIDMWCENRSSTCRFEDGKLKIIGTIMLNLLAYDSEGVPNCYERPVDFEYAHPCDGEADMLSAQYSVTVTKCTYAMTAVNTLSIAAEPTVEASVYENCKTELITEAELSQEKASSDRVSSIILYFADAGENIWDIAKKYNSSISEIKELNGITEDILSEAKKFLIPTK